MSKVLNKLLKDNPNKIEGISDESENGDGYWIYLKGGWWCTFSQSRTIHCWTIKETLSDFRAIIELNDTENLGDI